MLNVNSSLPFPVPPENAQREETRLPTVHRRHPARGFPPPPLAAPAAGGVGNPGALVPVCR
jgi:hypothetical protein